MALLFVGNACLGLVMPATFVMALEEHGDIAGLASSLGGTIQMVTGSLLVALTAPFFDGTPLPMVATIAFCAVMAFVVGPGGAAPRAPVEAAPGGCGVKDPGGLGSPSALRAMTGGTTGPPTAPQDQGP